MNIARSILLKYWGYSAFRPLQEEIINSVMEGKDTLALMPTGGGKSVCFQVPGLVNDGLCLVITPLIALMKDQVEQLRRRGIKAVAVYSGLARPEIEVIYDNCMFGDIKFLYLSPERLESDHFLQVLPRMKVNLIAVDEAHCISQWGYDFRPPYLRIAEIRRFHPNVPVLALTATATGKVIDDIQEKLSFSVKNVFRKSFERKNLVYVVVKEEDKMGRLLRILDRIKGTAIIYVRNRKKTREISNYLNKQGLSADFYHAGLDMASRSEKQSDWIDGRKRIIIATNAFGMGIDKPDVRLVIHLDLPDSLEAYFQEAGRAGRDGNRSYAVVLYEESDLINLKRYLENEFPDIKTIRSVYQWLGNFFQLAEGSGKDQVFDFDIAKFIKMSGIPAVTVYASLRFLEREGYIALNDNFGTPAKVHVKVSRDDLYKFQVARESLDPLIKLLLRSYTGLFNDFVNIEEKLLANRFEKSVEEVKAMLLQLVQAGLIDYLPQTTSPQIIFTRERLDPRHMEISPENYSLRKKDAYSRVQSVIDYVVSETHCRSAILLGYFGEKNAKRCGYCDFCRKRNKLEVSEFEFDQIVEVVKPHLISSALPLGEILSISRAFREEDVIRVLRWLEDNGKVVRDDQNNFTWSKQFRLKL